MLPIGSSPVLLLLNNCQLECELLQLICEWFTKSVCVEISVTPPKCALTFFLSRIDPLPRTIILHPVSCSNCFAVRPRGPKMRPTKLYWNKKECFRFRWYVVTIRGVWARPESETQVLVLFLAPLLLNSQQSVSLFCWHHLPSQVLILKVNFDAESKVVVNVWCGGELLPIWRVGIQFWLIYHSTSSNQGIDCVPLCVRVRVCSPPHLKLVVAGAKEPKQNSTWMRDSTLFEIMGSRC